MHTTRTSYIHTCLKKLCMYKVHLCTQGNHNIVTSHTPSGHCKKYCKMRRASYLPLSLSLCLSLVQYTFTKLSMKCLFVVDTYCARARHYKTYTIPHVKHAKHAHPHTGPCPPAWCASVNRTAAAAANRSALLAKNVFIANC